MAIMPEPKFIPPVGVDPKNMVASANPSREEIEAAKEYYDALMRPSQVPVYGVANGVNDVVRALVGGYGSGQASRMPQQLADREITNYITHYGIQQGWSPQQIKEKINDFRTSGSSGMLGAPPPGATAALTPERGQPGDTSPIVPIPKPTGGPFPVNNPMSGALGWTEEDPRTGQQTGGGTFKQGPTEGRGSAPAVMAQNVPPRGLTQQQPHPGPGPDDTFQNWAQFMRGHVRAGGTLPEALTLGQGLMGQMTKDDYGNIWRQRPGQVPEMVQQGPGKIVDYERVPGIHERYIQNINSRTHQFEERPFTPSQGNAPTAQPQRVQPPVGPGTGPNAGPSPSPAGIPASVLAGPGALRSMPGPDRPAEEVAAWKQEYDARGKGIIKQAEETASEFAKAKAGPVKEIIEHGAIGRKALEYLKTMEAIGDTPDAAKINTGPLAHEILKVKQFYKDLTGVDVGGVTAAESIDKLNAFLASLGAKELTNRPTQFDFKTFLERNPGIEISTEGRKFLIQALKQFYNQDYEIGKEVQKITDPSDLYDIMENAYQKHPIKLNFRGKELKGDEAIPEFNTRDKPTLIPGRPPGTVRSGDRWDPKTQTFITPPAPQQR